MSTNYRLPLLYHQKEGDGTLVIAHRGASAYCPENTMPAFEAAVEMEADMIELDVMLSSDGVPVVFHDAILSDHSDGQGLLSYHTLEELKALDAGAWFSEEFRGVKISTLEEALAFASGKIAVNIEIKTEAVSDQLSDGVEEKCLQLVEAYGMREHVLFSSFSYQAVQHLKKLDGDIPVAVLYNWLQADDRTPVELVASFKADAFNCSYDQFNKSWSQNLKEKRIPHFIYTVDRADHMHWLLDAGVSGIFTNKPDLLKTIIEQRK